MAQVAGFPLPQNPDEREYTSAVHTILIRKWVNVSLITADDGCFLNSFATPLLRQVQPRQVIIHEGQRPNRVYLVVEGWACRCNVMQDGRRQITGILLPGDIFDSSLFLLKRMDHTVMSLSAMTLIELTREQFEQLEANPRIREALRRDALVQASIQRRWLVNMGQLDAHARLAHLLCENFHRMRSLELCDGDSCPMPMRQVDLGEALGLSPVHVNRMLQELRQERLIEVRHKTLKILNRPAFEAVALFNPDYLHLNGRHSSKY